MKEKGKYNDKMIRDLIREIELMETPPGLNEQIMKEVRKVDLQKKRSPNFLRPAWILLFGAVFILPVFIKLIPGIITNLNGVNSGVLSFSANNFSFVFMVILAGALLLIAEQLIKLSFMKS
jgi:hypothetical protein